MSWCQLWAVRAARVTAAQVSRSQLCVDHCGVQTCAPLSLCSNDGDIWGGGLAAAAQVPESAPELRGQAAADPRWPGAGGRQGAAAP